MIMQTNVISWLRATADRFADKCALVDERSSLTFAQWYCAAQSIGSAIAESLGIVRQPVIVFVERRLESIVAFMGVAASGNFYVPIDSSMPASRLRSIVEQLNPIAAVSITPQHLNLLDEIGFAGVRLDYAEIVAHEVNVTELAQIELQMIDCDPLYVIFTSGSTGIPKGVVVSHRGVMDLTNWLVETFGFSASDNIANQTPFYFDASVKDIYISMRTGAELHIVPKKFFIFPKLLINYLNDNRISVVLWATSAVVMVGNSNIFEQQIPRYLKKVFFAGEPMCAKYLRVWRENLPDVQFVNLYGPTEITVDCTYYVVDSEFEDDQFIPIGKACRNKQVFVLNDSGRLAEQGEIGELYVRGTGVALGYFNNQSHSDEVFVQNPLHNLYCDRVYRTGDLVRCNSRGELEFVSRRDNQIKHQGYRIELGEIEAVACSIEGVTSAACIYDSQRGQIVLYYTTVDSQPIDVVAVIREQLPKYMVPSRVDLLGQMPYNRNGKIDRVELKRIYECQ